jgi:hypothetical protein
MTGDPEHTKVKLIHWLLATGYFVKKAALLAFALSRTKLYMKLL